MMLTGKKCLPLAAGLIVTLACHLASAQGAFSALAPGGKIDDGQTSIVYDPSTGEIGVDAPNGIALTSINIDSDMAIFVGDPVMNLGGDFDIDSNDTIFKATLGSSFGSISFGHVAQTGLSMETVLADLSVEGSLEPGGGLGNVDLVYVPEPSSIILVGLGLAGLLGTAWTRRRRA